VPSARARNASLLREARELNSEPWKIQLAFDVTAPSKKEAQMKAEKLTTAAKNVGVKEKPYYIYSGEQGPGGPDR
jgi:hypothetical protein